MENNRTERGLDLENPKTFNEKLQWLKLYDRCPFYTLLVDKYRVREYVAEKIGEQYLVQLLGVYRRFRDIDFSSLPNQFVLKCNHDSHSGIICKDKNKFDYEGAKSKITAALNHNYYYNWREWPYKNVKRCIIAEKYIEDITNDLPDFKVMCFNGNPKFIQVHKGRFTNHTQDFFDINWVHTDIYQEGMPNSSYEIEKPACLEEMLRLSEILAENIPEIRVDWYICNNRLYFSELTFFDGAGFKPYLPEHWNYDLGSLLKLPNTL